MYKIGQRVNVDNRNSTFPQDNRGTVLKIHIQYVVKLDGGLVGQFDSERISKMANPTSSKVDLHSNRILDGGSIIGR